jgi:hypothetical protein
MIGASRGAACVVQASIPCTGGVIHRIDDVLVRWAVAASGSGLRIESALQGMAGGT